MFYSENTYQEKKMHHVKTSLLICKAYQLMVSTRHKFSPQDISELTIKQHLKLKKILEKET